jgi:hypothetical protein
MRAIALGVVVLLCGCVDAVGDQPVPSSPEQAGQPLLTSDDPQYSWIRNPHQLVGHDGTNNCTFAFGQNQGCTVDAHEDSACFQHPAGHGGWIREDVRRVHCELVPSCGGPGDLYAVRLCRAGEGDPPWPSQPSPCGDTGPQGCAVCLPPMVVCH